MDKVLWATAMITVLLLHLGILHSPCKVHHELFHNPIDTVRVFAFYFFILLALSFSKFARQTVAVLGIGWFPLSFCKGKKLVVFGLVVLSIAWFHGL